MMPFSIIRIWFLGLFGTAIVATAAYLAWDWYRYDRQDEQLYWAIGLAAIALVGRFVYMPILGLGMGPPPLRPLRTKRLTRPDGTQINVDILREGSGPVVVLTHGWSLSSRVWGYVDRELPKDAEIITWDLRGLGHSSKSPTNDYSLEAMAGDMLEIVRLALGRPVILVGHSIGGMICLNFCRLFPAELGTTVTGIVLCETTYINPVKTAMFAPLWQTLQKPLIEPLLHVTIWLSPLVRLMNLQSYLNGSTHLITRITSFAGRQSWGQVELASRLSSFASPAVVARGMLAMLRLDESTTLTKIGIPVVVIAGINDRITRKEAGEHIARQAPHGQLVLLEPAGHLSLLERHEAVNASLSDLINLRSEYCKGRARA